MLTRHQRQALKYCMNQSCSALYMEMRLRKTRICIEAIVKRNAFPCLVICPYSAFSGWESDIKHYDKTCATLTGSSFARAQALKQDRQFYIMNYEGHSVIPKIKYIEWESIVLDESEKIKNYKTEISRFFVDNFMNVPFKYLLSGTPYEDEYELIQQFRFLRLTNKPYWSTFREFFIEVAPYKYSIRRSEQAKWKHLKEKCFFLTLKDAGYEKEKIYIQRDIVYPAQFYKEYKELFEKFIIEETSTVFAGERYLWMRKLCSGFVGDDLKYDNKLIELKKVLKQVEGSVVIYCQYTCEINLLSAEIRGEVINGSIKPKDRDEITRRFQNEEFKYLIVQPGTVKFGKDFSKANTIVTWSTSTRSTRKQSESRIVNLDKKDSLLYIDLVSKDTIEEVIVQNRYKSDKEIWNKLQKL